MGSEFNVIRIEQQFEIAAPLAKVWDALVKQTPQWWPRDFCTSPKAKAFHIEAKIGGRAYEDWGKGEGQQWYQVIGVESPVYLCMLGQLSPQYGGPAMTLLTLRLAENDKRNTTLSLSDFAFGRADESLRQSTDGGWRVLFGGFKKFCEGGKDREPKVELREKPPAATEVSPLMEKIEAKIAAKRAKAKNKKRKK
ncbi:MAG: SRPBCC domain-containing protein [Planctomycetes bacterium]|nr:SRPBCC domain-containing protein [Planctomycetota bacterium]